MGNQHSRRIVSSARAAFQSLNGRSWQPGKSAAQLLDDATTLAVPTPARALTVVNVNLDDACQVPSFGRASSAPAGPNADPVPIRPFAQGHDGACPSMQL